MSALFAFAGVSHPQALTEGAVNHWVALGRANNTRRGRLARACTFLRWCVRQGEADPALVEQLQSRENPLRSTPPLYGKLQGKYPARWLTHEEAFGTLLGVCDGSDVGRRDELIFRLGLAGMRVSEILHLTVGNLQPGGRLLPYKCHTGRDVARLDPQLWVAGTPFIVEPDRQASKRGHYKIRGAAR